MYGVEYQHLLELGIVTTVDIWQTTSSSGKNTNFHISYSFHKVLQIIGTSITKLKPRLKLSWTSRPSMKEARGQQRQDAHLLVPTGSEGIATTQPFVVIHSGCYPACQCHATPLTVIVSRTISTGHAGRTFIHPALIIGVDPGGWWGRGYISPPIFDKGRWPM